MNNTFVTLILSLAIIITTANCSKNTINGEKGIVRFTQIVNNGEVESGETPVAVKGTVLLKLERTTNAADPAREKEAQVTMTLVASRISGKGEATILPLGFAQFAVQFDDEGSFRLAAKSEGQEIDSFTMTSKYVDALRFSNKFTIHTEGKKSNGDSCFITTMTEEVPSKLHRNQELAVTVVPLDVNENVLTGMLGLTANYSPVLSFTVPLLMTGGTPNMLYVRPAGKLGSQAELTIHSGSAKSATIAFETVDSDAVANCR